MCPSFKYFLVSLVLGDNTAFVVLAELENFFVRSRNDSFFGFGCHQVIGRERKTTAGALAETKLVHVIQQLNRFATTEGLVTVRNHNREIATLKRVVVVIQALRQHHVEHDPAVAGLDDLSRQTLAGA